MAEEQAFMASTTFRIFGVNTDLLNVFNMRQSARVIRIYRMMLINSGGFSAGSAFNRVQVTRNRWVQGGTPSNVEAFSGDSSLLDVNTTCSYQQTLTSDLTLRNFQFAGSAWFTTTAVGGTHLSQIPYATIWDAGYQSNDVQPLTCPIGTGVGYGMFSLDAFASGVVDPFIEFTSEAA